MTPFKVGDTLPLWVLVADANNVILTGLTTLVVDIVVTTPGAGNEGYYWDFASSTFKNSGWTTRQATLTEVANGYYKLAGGWNTTGLATDSTYAVTYNDSASPTTTGNLPATDDFKLAGWVANLNVALAALTGTASAGAATSITLTGGSSTTNVYRFSNVTITGGTGVGQTRAILYYDGSTKIATVNRSWTTNPDNTSTYAVLPSSDPLIIDAGLAQAGGGSTLTLRSGSSSTTDFYVGTEVVIVGGTGAGQNRVVSAYNGSTLVATVASAWATNPDSTSVYMLLPVGRAIAVSVLDKTGYSIGTGGITAASFASGALITAGAVLQGTASAGSANSITLTGGAATDQLYKRLTVIITAGTGAGQASTILSYVGSTGVATVGPNWTTAPDNTSVFAVLPAAHPLVMTSGLLQGATSTTATLISSSTATDNYYNGAILVIRSGTGAGQYGLITGYVGATKVATVAEAWVTTPDATSGYEILPMGRAKVSAALAGSLGSVFDEATSGHTTAGSFGALLGTNLDTTVSSRLATSGYTAPPSAASVASAVWATAVPGAFTSGQAGNVLGTFLDAKISLAPGLVWDAATSGHVGVGSFGLLAGNLTNLDAAVSTRLATSGYTAPPSAATNAAAVWNALTASFVSAGSFGALLGAFTAPPSAATIAAAVWQTAVPGSFTSGQAGNVLGNVSAAATASAVWDALTASHVTSGTYGLLIGTNLDTNVGSRAAPGAAMTLSSGAIVSATFGAGAIDAGAFAQGAADKVWSTATRALTDKSGFSLASASITAGTFAANALGAVWDELHSAHLTAGTFGLLLDVAISSRSTLAAGAAMTLTAGERTTLQSLILTDATPFQGARIDAAVSSRLATVGYTAPLDATGTAAAVWNALTASYAASNSFGALLGGYTTAPTAAAVASAVWGTAGGLTSTVLAASAITAIQAGLATAGAVATVQTTTNTISVGVSAIQGTGFTAGVDDLHSAHALLAGAATGSALATAVTTIDAHTDSATAALATSTGLSALQTHGDATWSTAIGFATSSALATGLTAIEGAGFTTGDDLHALRAALNAVPSAPSAATISAQVGTDLAAAHGAGSWVTATGFAVPGSAMTLTSGERGTLQALILSDATPFAGARIANLDAAVSSRLPTSSYVAPLNGAATAAAVWDAATSGHVTAGSFGALLGVPFTLGAGSITASTLAASAITAIQGGLASATALAAVQADTTAIKGSGFVSGTDDLHSLHTAVTGTSAGAVAAAVWAASEGSPSAGTFGWGLRALRIALTNDMTITAPGTIILKDDAGGTFLTWSGVTDASAAPITLLGGEPAHRPKAT